MKNPQTPSGIEPENFLFVAQHLNYCATAVPTVAQHLNHCATAVPTVRWSSCKVPVILVSFRRNLRFIYRISKKKQTCQISHAFVQAEQIWSMRTDGQTDMTKLIVAFCERAYSLITKELILLCHRFVQTSAIYVTSWSLLHWLEGLISGPEKQKGIRTFLSHFRLFKFFFLECQALSDADGC